MLPLDEYSGSTMGNLPIGQGLSVTPMQMVAGYAAIANGGILAPPQLIERVGDEAVDEPRGATGDRARASRRRCGRCSRACWPGRHRLRGQRPRLHARRQDRNRRGGRKRHLLEDEIRRLVHRLRPGAGSALLVAVIVDQPQGEIYGGSVAAPAFGKIAEFALPYLGVPAE